MRLLNARSFELKEFFDSEIPRYAILSHTWGREEVLFQDMADLGQARLKYGFQKVQGACTLALAQMHDYIWIDTCCIDKSSSAELTEAINSMYRWYEGAAVCYAYLSDVFAPSGPGAESAFRQSRWFTRGWTLQELIAPSKLEFYSNDWRYLGNKKDASLSMAVSDITGIDMTTLLGGRPADVSIARRMHWASARQTTRIEDRAYSLIGLFDVNMPMIYGEGTKAFRRLQEEILKASDDQSIFAWYTHSDEMPVDVLATSPSDFAHSGTLSRQHFSRVGRKPTTITNLGITIELPIMSTRRLDSSSFSPFDEIEAILDCQLGSVPGTFPTIRLRSILSKGENGPRHYYRVMTAEMTKFEYFDKRAFIDDSPVLGLDPTQLHIHAYKDTLDHNYLQWKIESVIFTRDVPQSSGGDGGLSHIPWSLSLLAADFPPDDTGYWLVSFSTHFCKANITAAYPPENWDSSSMQFRVSTIPRGYYGVGKFQIIDGLFDIAIAYNPNKSSTYGDIYAAYHTATLAVGRRAESRRSNPQPWCRFLEGRVPLSDATTFIDSYDTTGNRQKEDGTTVCKLDALDFAIQASVRAKEISGVFHYVVGIQPIAIGSPPLMGLYLLNT